MNLDKAVLNSLTPPVKDRYYQNCYGEQVDRYTKCETCDGTGEIHSHNPLCYDCHGTGLHTSRERK